MFRLSRGTRRGVVTPRDPVEGVSDIVVYRGVLNTLCRRKNNWKSNPQSRTRGMSRTLLYVNLTGTKNVILFTLSHLLVFGSLEMKDGHGTRQRTTQSFLHFGTRGNKVGLSLIFRLTGDLRRGLLRIPRLFVSTSRWRRWDDGGTGEGWRSTGMILLGFGRTGKGTSTNWLFTWNWFRKSGYTLS